MIKNLIFDYGGVIFDIEHELMAEAFGELGVENMRKKVSHAGQQPLFDDFDKGAVSPAEFREGIRKLAGPLPGGRLLSDREIDDAWNAMLIGIPDGNLDLLERAKQKYRTFLLSNNNVLHYDWITAYLQREWSIDSIDPYFEKTWYSQHMGMRKPNRDIFEAVLGAHDLLPEETLFIDDTQPNIDAAAALGIQTRLVKKKEPLSQVLEELL